MHASHVRKPCGSSHGVSKRLLHAQVVMRPKRIPAMARCSWSMSVCARQTCPEKLDRGKRTRHMVTVRQDHVIPNCMLSWSAPLQVVEFVRGKAYARFTRIIFDTAPTGHMLCLLSWNASLQGVEFVRGDAYARFTCIIRDTAPTGHTLLHAQLECPFAGSGVCQGRSLCPLHTHHLRHSTHRSHTAPAERA